VQSALSSQEVRRDHRFVRNDDAGRSPIRRAPRAAAAGIPVQTFGLEQLPGQPPPPLGEQFSIWSSIWSGVTGVATTVSGVFSSIWEGIEAVASVPGLISQYEGVYELGGHSESTINTTTYWTVAGVIVAVMIGALVDILFPFCKLREGRPRWWLLALLGSSYTCLAVGLNQVLFSMIVAVDIWKFTLIFTEESDGSAGATTESMVSVIGLLMDSGAILGAMLVVTYAMILPAMKLILLLGGELFRFSPHAGEIAFSRGCIRFVQVISKWACPDMFAYILMMYLIRGLDDNTSVLESDAQLDIGFMLFSVFCIGSTVSSLAVKLPGEDRMRAEALADGTRPPAVILAFGRGGVALVSTALAVAFGLLLYRGLQLPVMSLTLDVSLLGLPSILEKIVDVLGLEDAVSTDVALFDCINKLLGWAETGESMSLLGFVMFGGFALGLTILDMLVLIMCALMQGCCKTAPGLLSVAMGASHICRHLAMLDVAIMGIWVVCLATGAYKDQGVVLAISEGLYYLLGAEIVHYVTYYVVDAAVSFVDAPTVKAYDAYGLQVDGAPAAPAPAARALAQPPAESEPWMARFGAR
jgi:hypothetical protein